MIALALVKNIQLLIKKFGNVLTTIGSAIASAFTSTVKSIFVMVKNFFGGDSETQNE
jgi:hypothetical protein